MKILTEDEDDHQHHHQHQHQDVVEESHPPSLTFRLDQDNIAPAATEDYYEDEYYDDEEISSRERRRGGCVSISRNRKDICTAIYCFHGCYKTPKSRRSTVIIKVDGLINDDNDDGDDKNNNDDTLLSHHQTSAYYVICRSFLIFVMLAIMTVIIFVNSTTTTTQTGGAVAQPQPPPTSELSSSSSTSSSILHPMDGVPYSDGEYHYEGIGHNVLAPHISSSSSSSADGVAATPPPTSTPLLHPVIMDGEPHPEGEYHYESVGHTTILPINDSSTSYHPSSNSSNSTSISQNNAAVVVPFSDRYNLYVDGILFIKNATTHYSQQQQQYTQQQEQEQPNTIFNSYAKTIDPVTEIHFSPGESTTTKQIIFSTNPPDLSSYNNRIFNQQPFLSTSTSTSTSSMVDIEENAAIIIGLQSNGNLWLPRNNIINDNESNSNNSNNNLLYHDDANKEMYGAGDQFVLKIMNANDNGEDNDNGNNNINDSKRSNSRIRLYRNNNELVGEWRNPYPDSTKLYAQIWFQDGPKSSMFAYALNNNNKEEEEDSSGNSNGQINYRQLTLLRGRKDYF